MVLPDHGPADFLRRGLRRGRGVLTVGIKTEFRRGEAEAGVDLHRAPFIIFRSRTARRGEGLSNSRLARVLFECVRVKADVNGHLIDERTFGGACLGLGGGIIASKGVRLPRRSLLAVAATSTAFNAAPLNNWSTADEEVEAVLAEDVVAADAAHLHVVIARGRDGHRVQILVDVVAELEAKEVR